MRKRTSENPLKTKFAGLPFHALRWIGARRREGVEFPARKEELLGRLERNGVPGPVLGQLRKRLPEGEYRGSQDVLSALRGGR